MEIEAIISLIKSGGIPIAHIKFSKAQQPPYMCYVEDSQELLTANCQKALSITDYDFELYRRKEDNGSENKIDAVFDANGVLYDKTYNYLEDMDLLEVIYSITE